MEDYEVELPDDTPVSMLGRYLLLRLKLKYLINSNHYKFNTRKLFWKTYCGG